MKITLWQQFSSNHSSHFIVIGRFQTVSDAEAKTAELRDWMHRMLWGNDDTGEPKRTAEAEIVAKYGVDWYEDGIDWNGYPDSLDETVRQVHNDVLMICPVETWDSHRPFIELLEKMGAQNVVQHHSDWYSEGIVVDLECVAPNAEVAQEVFTSVKRVLDAEYSVRDEVPFPWAKFGPDFQTHASSVSLSVDHYDKAEATWVSDEKAWHDFRRENSIITYDRTQHRQFIRQDSRLFSAITEIRESVTIDEGNIQLDDKLVSMKNLNFAYVDKGIIALLGWLNALGCEVNYQFRERNAR